MKHLKLYKTIILLCATPLNVVAGILINGADINQLAKKGEMVSFSSKDGEAKDISLIVKKSELYIGALCINEQFKQQMSEPYDNLSKQHDERSKDPYIVCFTKTDQEFDHYHLQRQENILLKAGESIHIKHSIFSAKKVVLLARKLSFDQFFLKDADYFQFESYSPHSLIKLVRFTVSDKTKPALVYGYFDFTNSDQDQHCTVMGATNLEIVFNDSAFDQ